MDDTTSLVSDLIQKLAELDNKVNIYRQDMAQEFHRYSRQRLQDVPGHVSAKVQKLVAEHFQNYPALSPGLDYDIDPQSQESASDVSTDEKSWPVRQPSPPVSPQIPFLPLFDSPRSPHEREREFHGLFTPSYLPLLDAVQRRSPTPPTLPPQVPEIKEPNSHEDTSAATLASPIVLPRPDPVRRHTTDTEESITSDDSTTRLRRSALRRSSTSSVKAQSPRRVRFDVEGEEVLPTSSPPISPRAPDFPPSPLGNPAGLLDESYNAIIINEDTDLLGSSPPMPKKITSTDRLKAMARNSNEDTSKWEVVGNLEALNDDEEEELVMAGLHSRKANDTYQNSANHVSSDNTAHHINDARLPSQLGAPLTVVKEVEENEVPAEGDEIDDVLMMPPLSSFKDKKRFSPPLETTPKSAANIPNSNRTENDLSKSPIDSTSEPSLNEEDLFDFDDRDFDLDDREDKSKPVKKYIDEEDEDVDEDEADATPIAEKPVLFSTSPAIPVAKPASATPPLPSPHQMAASVGSYRGKSFSIGVVRDPELHKRAAEMGDFYTFVGSVDGRSGVDESTSYRPDMTYFDGTPRSLSERLMKEDLDEARRNAETNSRD
ncbi:uncharacterized protein GGS22DRAFT_109726 [Annulohypoxylon maeteangense]|uniref:uncharacterized protein n=1 Tax=Annulohypoxylon maeteangense TaxID=1927788 RepID=UPI002008AB8D|nr:uncharacterized protein GGS22DRAFT_109726 [Annulohypoxylon maeteangense]KAI0887465.1 hypothetical protein GGS22DRAFT_109726 [Annulohypoxylon maeteangense]